MSFINNPPNITETFIIEPLGVDIYTTGATLIGNVIYFDRTDALSAYTANLNSIVTTDTYVTGMTFSNNLLTITRNDGVSITSNINNFVNLNVSGTLSATTFYGDGSHLTGISTQDTYVTGGTYSNGIAIFTNNSGGTFTVSGFYTGTTPFDVFVTGGTYSNGITTFTNNTGGTFSVSGYSTGYTLTSTGITSALGYVPYDSTNPNNYISGITFGDVTTALGYTPLSAFTDTYVTGATYSNNKFIYTNNTGGTFDVLFDTMTGLTVNTISATTYYNLPTDVYVTGGTYSNGTTVFRNNTGGTFSVTGFSTGYTLNEVLINGNDTSGKDINLTEGDRVVVGANRAGVGKGTFDRGGDKGVSQYCAAERELNWQLGSQYVYDDSGYVRVAQFKFNIEPQSYDDDTQRFKIGSRWILDDGSSYICTDATTNNAVWVKEILDIYVTGFTFNNGNYDIIINQNDGSVFTQNLSILASDVTITGGTYNINTGIVTFTNNSGGTFNVTGFTSGMTDSYTTGATLNGNIIEFNNNLHGLNYYSVDLTPIITANTSTINLQKVTENGNHTTNDIYVPNLYLNGGDNYLYMYDSIFGDYGSIRLYDNHFYFDTYPNNSVLKIEEGSLKIINGNNYNADIFINPLITKNHSYELPDDDGIIALEGYVDHAIGSVGLQQVTDVSNTTNNRINVREINLWDEVGNDYNGNINFNNNNFIFQNLIGSEIFRVENDRLGLTNSAGFITYISNIDMNKPDVIFNFPQKEDTGTYTIATTDMLQYFITDAPYDGNVYGRKNGNWSNIVIPTDTYVTGGTYSNGTATFKNNSGGIFSVTGFSTGTSFTGGTVTGATTFTNGLTANTISATTYNGYVPLPYSGAVNNLDLGNNNLYVNDIYEKINIIPSISASTLILNNTSVSNYVISGGTGNQTIQMPDATTLPSGATFTFNNNTNYIITINNGAVSPFLITQLNSGAFVTLMLLTNTSKAGTWDYHFNAPSNVSWSTNTFSYSGSITSAQWNGSNIALNRGGTNSNITANAGAIVYSTSSALTLTNTGTTGQILTSQGSLAPIWSTPITFTGGTVSGATTFTNGLTANTFSATTYQNLPLDIRVTGGTYSNGTTTFTNNTGGTFSVTGFSTVSSFTGGTVSEATTFTSGLTANTISATTYQNLPTDIRVTGGTYSNGTTVFTNNTGGTFSITGFSTGYTLTSSGITTTLGYTPYNSTNPNGYISGITFNNVTTALGYTPLSAYTNTYVTGGTFNTNTDVLTFTNNTGGTFTVTGITDYYVTGGTYSNGTATFTNSSGSTFSVTGFSTGYTLTSSAITSTLGYYNYKNTTSSSTLTGTLTETQLVQVTIPANTFSPTDFLKIRTSFVKTGGLGTATIKYKISTSATMPTGTTGQIAFGSSTAANSYINFTREQLSIKSGNITGFPFTAGGGALSDLGASSNSVISSLAFDVTVLNYIYISVTLANAGDTIYMNSIQITNI